MVFGFPIFWIKEGIGLVEANDVGTVLQHHRDEWPLLHRHVFLTSPALPCTLPLSASHVGDGSRILPHRCWFRDSHAPRFSARMNILWIDIVLFCCIDLGHIPVQGEFLVESTVCGAPG